MVPPIGLPPFQSLFTHLIENLDRPNEVGGASRSYLDGAEHLVSERYLSFTYWIVAPPVAADRGLCFVTACYRRSSNSIAYNV